MDTYKKEFIEFCLANKVLLFGGFTIKSGRKSPYFFNAGLFDTGESLAILGGYYAKALHDAAIEYDVIFGPAYKGIPLAATTAIAMASVYQQPSPYAYDRKEVKAHGEGGILVGSDITDKRVVIVDDVISAGTSSRRCHEILADFNATMAGVIIALDRQEVGTGELSAVQEVEENFATSVHSIICLADLIEYLRDHHENQQHLDAMLAYQQQYGIKN